MLSDPSESADADAPADPPSPRETPARAGHGGRPEVLVVADSPITQHGLKAMIDAPGDLRARALGSALRDVATELRASQPAVVVVASVRALVLLHLHAHEAPIVVLEDDPSDQMIVDLFAAGARGLILEESVSELLVPAVRAALASNIVIDPRATTALVAKALTGRRTGAPLGLTPREHRVLSLVAEGATNREIAERLAVSPETVKTHLRRLMAKLGAHDRLHATAIAKELGLVR